MKEKEDLMLLKFLREHEKNCPDQVLCITTLRKVYLNEFMRMLKETAGRKKEHALLWGLKPVFDRSGSFIKAN